MPSHLAIFGFIVCAFGIISSPPKKIHCQSQDLWTYLLCFLIVALLFGVSFFSLQMILTWFLCMMWDECNFILLFLFFDVYYYMAAEHKIKLTVGNCYVYIINFPLPSITFYFSSIRLICLIIPYKANYHILHISCISCLVFPTTYTKDTALLYAW